MVKNLKGAENKVSDNSRVFYNNTMGSRDHSVSWNDCATTARLIICIERMVSVVDIHFHEEVSLAVWNTSITYSSSILFWCPKAHHTDIDQKN